MTPLAATDKLFFERADAALDRAAAEATLGSALTRSDDGELYLEYRESEQISLDDGRIRSAGFDTSLGFGLRAVAGEATGYAHAGELSEPALRRAASSVAAVAAGHSGVAAEPPRATNARLYSDANPLGATEFPARTALLAEIDAYARGKDARVVQVMASLAGEWQAVQIMRADGTRVADLRPLVRLNVAVVVEQAGRRETGSYGTGGRFAYDHVTAPDGLARRGRRGAASGTGQSGQRARRRPARWRSCLAPAGPASCCTRRSATAWRATSIARRPRRLPACWGSASRRPGVTVVDDGTLPDRRGSLTVDDEGTPTSRTVLIEDGVLVGFMQDRLNARLMGMRATGNGRRQSYAHAPMPRMTNTVMLAGAHAPEEMIRSVKRGLYAVNFGGGQVDITSGKFVFSASEAYLIEDGKVTAPVKGATLIGNGPDALTKVAMVGNDMALDPGIGTCGKNGQGVPVGRRPADPEAQRPHSGRHRHLSRVLARGISGVSRHRNVTR